MSILVATTIAAACFTVDLGVQSFTEGCPESIEYEAQPPPPKPPVRMDIMSWKSFTSIPNGTQVFNNGYDQCVALANKYHQEELGGSFVGVASAYQWWTEFESRPSLTSIYTKSSKPIPGAIFVSRGGGIYDAKHGHIGVVVSVNPNGTFNTMEQNAGTWRYTGRYTRNLEAVYGFLIPKNNPATPHSRPAGSSASRDKKWRTKRKARRMIFVYELGKSYPEGIRYATYTPGVKGSWDPFTGQASANELANQLGSAMRIWNSRWNTLEKRWK